ncbi:MAG: hypothetical protein ACYSX0_09880 [Planctomycetota bacterium]|jgi:hypothetical protein
MRSAYLLLCIAGAAIAQDPFADGLRHLQAARKSTFTTGTRAEVLPAIERFIHLKDARCAKPLVEFLVATMTGEGELHEKIRSLELERDEAKSRLEALDRELALLRRRVESGAADLGPVIEKRRAERGSQERSYFRSREELARDMNQVGVVREMREKLAAGLIVVLSAQEDEDASRKARDAVTGALDTTDAQQSLFLIRILRESAPPGATKILIAMLDDSRTTVPGEGARVRMLLGLAAKRQLKSLEDARAWAASLRK